MFGGSNSNYERTASRKTHSYRTDKKITYEFVCEVVRLNMEAYTKSFEVIEQPLVKKVTAGRLYVWN